MASTVHRDARRAELVEQIREIAALEEHHAGERLRFAADYRAKVKTLKRAAERFGALTGAEIDYAIEDFFNADVDDLKLDAQEWRTEAARLSR